MDYLEAFVLCCRLKFASLPLKIETAESQVKSRPGLFLRMVDRCADCDNPVPEPSVCGVFITERMPDRG
jgi:hypothetical protein